MVILGDWSCVHFASDLPPKVVNFYPSFFGDDASYHAGRMQYRFGVFLFFQIGESSRQRFWQHNHRGIELQIPPDFDPILAVRQRKKNQNASIVIFMTDPPTIEKRVDNGRATTQSERTGWRWSSL